MFSEIFHGLLERTLKDSGINRPTPDTPPHRPQIRIGIIPAGKNRFEVIGAVGSVIYVARLVLSSLRAVVLSGFNPRQSKNNFNYEVNMLLWTLFTNV